MDDSDPIKKGREGKVYVHPSDPKKIIKLFRKNKNHNDLIQEFQLQRDAAQHGLAPAVYQIVRFKGRWGMVMDRLDHTLMDEIRDANELDEKRQRDMVKLLDGLDRIGIFHGDVSPLNFMVRARDKRLFLIDFGMSRRIGMGIGSSNKNLGDRPNRRLGTAAFILKLRQFVPDFSPEYLLRM